MLDVPAQGEAFGRNACINWAFIVAVEARYRHKRVFAQRALIGEVTSVAIIFGNFELERSVRCVRPGLGNIVDDPSLTYDESIGGVQTVTYYWAKLL